MERLKLVNVLKSTFMGSEFLTFTIRSLKMLLLREMRRFFLHNLYLWPRAGGRIFSSKNFSLSKWTSPNRILYHHAKSIRRRRSSKLQTTSSVLITTLINRLISNNSCCQSERLWKLHNSTTSSCYLSQTKAKSEKVTMMQFIIMCVVESLVWSWALTNCKLQTWHYTSSLLTRP